MQKYSFRFYSVRNNERQYSFLFSCSFYQHCQVWNFRYNYSILGGNCASCAFMKSTLSLGQGNSVSRGVCIQVGLHPRGRVVGVASRGVGQTPLSTMGYGQQTGGMHHTGMHSCCQIFLVKSLPRPN